MKAVLLNVFTYAAILLFLLIPLDGIAYFLDTLIWNAFVMFRLVKKDHPHKNWNEIATPAHHNFFSIGLLLGLFVGMCLITVLYAWQQSRH